MEIPLRYAYQLGAMIGRSSAPHYHRLDDGEHAGPLEGAQSFRRGFDLFWKTTCKCGREFGPAPSKGQVNARLQEHIKAMEQNKGRNRK